MLLPSASAIPGFLLVWGACLWLLLLTYNVLICRLDRSPLKNAIKRTATLAFLIAPPLLFLLAPLLPPTARIFDPANPAPGARVTLWLSAAVLLFAASGQAITTWRLLRPPRIASLTSVRARSAPYRPGTEDWAFFEGHSAATACELETAGHDPADPPPPLTGKVRALRPPGPMMRRVLLSPAFRRLDRSYDLQIVECTVRSDRLPVPFDGLRVAHLSDLHYGALLAEPYCRHVVAETARLEPDLVILTGDYTADDNLYRRAIETFAPLAPPEGVYAVRGNHDHYTEPERIAHWLRRAGIHLLDGRSIDIERQGHAVRLFGLEHPFFPEPRWRGRAARELAEAEFAIAATHTPDPAPALARLGADLILAGHTHGGQWRLPVIGPPVVPSIHGRRYARGLCETQGGLLHVSPGIGLHTVPLRVGCPPEVTLFVLRAKETCAGLSPPAPLSDFEEDDFGRK